MSGYFATLSSDNFERKSENSCSQVIGRAIALIAVIALSIGSYADTAYAGGKHKYFSGSKSIGKSHRANKSHRASRSHRVNRSHRVKRGKHQSHYASGFSRKRNSHKRRASRRASPSHQFSNFNPHRTRAFEVGRQRSRNRNSRHRNLKIITGPYVIEYPVANRPLIDRGPGRDGVIYYNEEQCTAGYDCNIRLGNSVTSPRIIVIGKKRRENPKETDQAPRIFYPPS